MAENIEFLFPLVHDLRSNLRRISMVAQKLDRSSQGEPPEEWANLREAIAEQEQLLARTVRYAEASADYDRAWTPLSLVFRGIQGSCRQRLGTCEGRLEFQLCPEVSVPGNMAPVMEELVDNSIKFRSPDAPLIVIVTADLPPEASAVQIAISDNGTGIPAAYRHKVLQPFFRAHPRRSYPGAGLGLAICARHLEAMGGRIEVMERTEPGTRIEIFVPCHLTGTILPNQRLHPH